MEISTIVGLIAATLTTASFLPQAVKTIKTKKTKDLSLGMYIILTIGITLWLIYGILVKDIPVIVANGISVIFASVILSTILFSKSYSSTK